MPLRMSLRSRWVTVRPLSFSNQSPAKGRKKKESYNNVNKWIESTFQGRKGHDRDRRLLSPCWTWANPPWCSGPPGMSFSTITRWRNDTWPCQSGHCGTPATKPRTSSQQTPPSPPPVFLLPPLLWGFVGINVFTNLCYIIFSLSYIQQTPLSADCSGNCSILYTHRWCRRHRRRMYLEFEGEKGPIGPVVGGWRVVCPCG